MALLTGPNSVPKGQVCTHFPGALVYLNLKELLWIYLFK